MIGVQPTSILTATGELFRVIHNSPADKSDRLLGRYIGGVEDKQAAIDFGRDIVQNSINMWYDAQSGAGQEIVLCDYLHYQLGLILGSLGAVPKVALAPPERVQIAPTLEPISPLPISHPTPPPPPSNALYGDLQPPTRRAGVVTGAATYDIFIDRVYLVRFSPATGQALVQIDCHAKRTSADESFLRDVGYTDYFSGVLTQDLSTGDWRGNLDSSAGGAGTFRLRIVNNRPADVHGSFDFTYDVSAFGVVATVQFPTSGRSLSTGISSAVQ